MRPIGDLGPRATTRTHATPMALRGDLASVDLAQVFQMLALNKKVGLLSIQSTRLWKILYFDQRGVTLHHNVHRVIDRLVAAFVRNGRLQEAVVDEVRDHAARVKQSLADGLLAGGYLEPTELEEQYRIELEEEIYDLFFCRDARFEFHEGVKTLEGRDGEVDERFFSNCDSVIMEAARRIDEWAYISERVPTTGEVLVATADAIDGEQYGADGPPVFELLDGRRNVARIVELTGLSNFQVCKVLSQLLDGGAVAPVAAEELLPLAQECLQTNRLQDAISLYERAIELGVGLPAAHTAAAKAYQTAEEYEHAAWHFECEAEHRLTAGDRVGAATLLQQVRQLVPTDLRARERLLELTVGQGAVSLPGFEPMAEGKLLVDLLLEFGDLQRVRNLLERLLRLEPTDPELKKALVNVHAKAGDQKRVAELYESMADDLVRQQKPLEAVGYLQKILLLDRSRTDISERVRKLYEFDERSRRRGRALTALALLFCILLVGGAGYWFYNQRAEEEFARIDVQESLQREDFAAAQAAYDAFLLAHPLTTSVPKARAELAVVEAARQRFEARRTSERAQKERELQALRDEYKAAMQKHRELFLGGNPEASLVALSRVKELIGKAGTPEDVAWGIEQQVERTWQRLTEFVSEAEKIHVAWAERLAAGDWSAARTLALRLHAEFDSTKQAKSAAVPIRVVTRPAGALLLQDGAPMTRQVDGQQKPLTTPAIVLCPGAAKVAFTTRRDGFEPRSVVIDPTAHAEVELVLSVVPAGRIVFEAPVQTGLAIAEGWLAAGLRGGRLGLARVDGSSVHTHALDGLKAVDGTPVIQGGRVFFVTNEGTVECVPIDGVARSGRWPIALPSGAATELIAGDGRLAVVDRDNVLWCWEQASGARLWSVSLDSPPSGPPTFDRRQVVIGTNDGRLLVLDAQSGSVVMPLRCPTGLSTRVAVDAGVFWFGCLDGNVRAVDTEGRVLWATGVGRNPIDGLLALTKQALLVVDGTGRLLALDRQTGKQLGALAIDGQALPGMRVQGDSLLLQVRRTKIKNKPLHDALLVVDSGTLTMTWEYADVAPSAGTAGADDLAIGLPASGGEVVLFR
jgi:tetratricopeptide (TPR) repeat protein